MITVKQAKKEGFEKALKVMWQLLKEKEPYENGAKKFVEEFAKVHRVELK